MLALPICWHRAVRGPKTSAVILNMNPLEQLSVVLLRLGRQSEQAPGALDKGTDSVEVLTVQHPSGPRKQERAAVRGHVSVTEVLYRTIG